MGNFIINRVWAMPNKWTFKVKPITELLNKYVGDGVGWIDPFAGTSQYCEFSNDIKENQPNNMDAIEYLNSLPNGEFKGILLDPPYSYRQLFKTYKTNGNNLKVRLVPMTELNNIANEKINRDGYAISFGWNSCGLGLKRGFEIVEILVICHGGHHNDTIVTVEKRTPKLF